MYKKYCLLRCLSVLFSVYGWLDGVYAAAFKVEPSLIEDVRRDISLQADHVDRLKQSTVAYLERGDRQFTQGTLTLLLGLKGLSERKPPKEQAKNNKKRAARMQKQKDWALEFILRYTYDTFHNVRESPNGPNEGFLAMTGRALAGIWENDKALMPAIDWEHVSFCVLASLAFQWDIDRELYRSPIYPESRLDFIRNKENYKSLNILSTDRANTVHHFITQKIRSDAELTAFLKASGYASAAHNILNYIRIGSSTAIVPGYKYSLSGTYECPIDITLKRGQSSKSQKKPFETRIRGTIKGVKGDGACYYHTIRDFREGINDWGSNAGEVSRHFVATEIQKHLDDPMVRYWVSKAAMSHLRFYINQEGRQYPWVTDHGDGKVFRDLLMRLAKLSQGIHEITEPIYAETSKITEAYPEIYEQDPEYQRLMNELETNQRLIALRTEHETLQKELDYVENKLERWFYSKKGCSTFLKKIVTSSDLAVVDCPISDIVAYMYGCERLYFYMVADGAENRLNLILKKRLTPYNGKIYSMIEYANHSMWIKDINVIHKQGVKE